ncbi:MAG: class B sortase [Oscillospiraceae bacterium]|nr:class B sortase [Oscillospiraceae bacterium]
MKKIALLMSVIILISATVPTAFASTRRPPANAPRGLEARVLQALEVNTDTRGWLYVPGTTINGLVMQDHPTTREDGTVGGSHFYNSHNFSKEEDPRGIPYIDYRSEMRLGSLPRNTVIYGKSDTDDPNGAGFAQLKKYLNDDFAAKNPYIYYSDGRNTYTFLVFAVYKTHMGLPYNVPDLGPAEMRDVLSTAKELSVREYPDNNWPSDSARILTLSTTVSTVDSNETFMPPEFFRFVVMAKAVVPRG